MEPVGEGYHVFMESLTHTDRGYPDTTAPAHHTLVTRLNEKIHRNRFEIYDVDERWMDGAEVVVVCYGITARVAAHAITAARKRGVKVGMFRLRTAWPFPEERIRELSATIRGFVVPEINLGQMSREVERCALDACAVATVPNAGGEIHEPEQILEAIIHTAEGRSPNRTTLIGAR